MTVIIFLVDNGPLMLQQTMLNEVRYSYINLAKRMVESMLKLRESHENRKLDRYMLLTYDTPPNHVKAGWKESKDQFNEALKNLQCTGSVPETVALDNAFELLNQERRTVGMDTYGCGRSPSNTMYSFVILITNYRPNPVIIEEPMTPPHLTLTGPPLTKESFRWDQRLFGLILGSTVCTPFVSQFCRKTGGWCMAINSKKCLHRSIAKVMNSLKLELMVDFVHEAKKSNETGDLSTIELHTTKCAIACCSKKSWWPFPESYWLRDGQTTLTPRDAHPVVRILSKCCTEPVWSVGVPIDRYQLRVCKEHDTTTLPVMDYGKVWPVEIVSTMDQVEQPFGYLKKESNRIFLYVLPYDYMALNRLLTDNRTQLNVPNRQLHYALKHYISTVPKYYCFYLRKALTGIVEESMLRGLIPPDKMYFLNAALFNQLVHLQHEAQKSRFHLCSYVAQQLIPSVTVAKPPETIERLNLQKLFDEETVKENKPLYLQPVVLPTMTERTTPNYRNPYTFDRRNLLDTYNLLRNTFYYPDTVVNLRRNAPQASVPTLRTPIDSKELVAEVVQYQRQHPDRRTPTKRKPNSTQQNLPKVKKFCLTDI
ncbi:integrator complex subunit 6-like [Anopheles maculipalpis]|uniref:integrator complex subunit 6-like n=1 Tax=Anopheles maculipalpis TaxID=1496333 RepID=UPI002158E477|nr:integrator complex subunit 6-like [Anopheles maculipalpis]